jgi:TRAP-type uncharacterized transport system substrate-binding protein
VPEPRIGRSVTLHFKGDWGQANLHRICGWVSQEFNDRAGPYSKAAIWSGRGMVDSVLAVGRGEVDVALAVPAAIVPMALDGSPPFDGEAFPQLRALGTMPQTDRLVVALKASHGVRSFAELRDKKPRLAIATSPDDGVNTVGFAAHRLMELADVPRQAIEAWGGRYVEAERPGDCTRLVQEGRADAIIYEAIMTGFWRDLANAVDLVFLPVEDGVLERFRRQYRWPRATLPPGYLRGLEQELTTLDFSDFLMIARADLPDDVAYLIAWCMCERREGLERQYRHLPPERSPVTYPLDPVKIARTAIPLHPGAERYYRDAGVL